MKKIIFGMVMAVMAGGCSLFSNDDLNHFTVISGQDDTSYLKDVDACPKVHIRQEDVKIVQIADYRELFAVKATGYEGFCYFNEKVQKDRAVIKPRFKITRLEDSDVTDVHFSYYLETVEGPEGFLGKKTYFASVNIPQGVHEVDFTADIGELSIPVPGTYDLDVFLGLMTNGYDLEYKSK